MTERQKWSNKFTQAGNILESEILNTINLPPENRNIKLKLKDSFIGANLDGWKDNVLIEAKTMKYEIAFKVMNGYALPAGYKRQMNHGMYVATQHFAEISENKVIDKAEMYILPITEKDYENPFGADMSLVFKIDYELPNIEKYVKRLNFLDWCFKNNKTPSEALFEDFSEK